MQRIPINSYKGIKRGKRNKTLRGLTSNETAQILELNGFKEDYKSSNKEIVRFDRNGWKIDLRKTIESDVKSKKTKEKQVIQLSLFPN
jgi:hypothetical protein